MFIEFPYIQVAYAASISRETANISFFLLNCCQMKATKLIIDVPVVPVLSPSNVLDHFFQNLSGPDIRNMTLFSHRGAISDKFFNIG